MYTLNYQMRNKAERQITFQDPTAAFDRFYKFCRAGLKAPFISSDEHIGFFSSSDIDWYMIYDDEGRVLAQRRYENWLKDYRGN